ncbi:MAG TPA: hypothetical protein VHZ77_01565 [Gaiellaceae bacterium]|nr:hypothetical protein [Gaiellaceae bacterium]
MPFQNRVTPLSELLATPERGLVYGNRGRLHDERGEIRREWQLKRWISCRLEFRGRYREGGPMAPGRYTGLFFLDEATAFAAGHRPCAECRNADYRSFLGLTGAAGADELDGRLHAERLGGDVAGRRLHERPLEELPDGAFVLLDDEPWLVLGDALRRWSPGGYTERRARPRGEAAVITPPTTLGVLEAGWEGSVPLLHPSSGKPS